MFKSALVKYINVYSMSFQCAINVFSMCIQYPIFSIFYVSDANDSYSLTHSLSYPKSRDAIASKNGAGGLRFRDFS